jgi:hypothetical protein
MMERALIRAADIHSGATAHGFKAFKDLDIVGGVVAARPCVLVKKSGFFGFTFGACHAGLT